MATNGGDEDMLSSQHYARNIAYVKFIVSTPPEVYAKLYIPDYMYWWVVQTLVTRNNIKRRLFDFKLCSNNLIGERHLQFQPITYYAY